MVVGIFRVAIFNKYSAIIIMSSKEGNMTNKIVVEKKGKDIHALVSKIQDKILWVEEWDTLKLWVEEF